MEISEYGTKESLAQQGGFGLATKGPQHDEAWLIFMDQILNLLPSFEDKAEALHYFPMWRTWFSLHGLCKLPWNDISPENNKDTAEPAKVEEHVENYAWIHEGVTGIPTTAADLAGSIRARLQLPEGLLHAHGTRGPRTRLSALPRDGACHRCGIRIPPGTL